MATIVRKSLGQVATIGSLYDASCDTFLPASIIRGELPPGSISTQPHSSTDISIVPDGSYARKFEALGVKQGAAASILAGLVEPRGSGVYLRREPSTTATLQGAVCHKVSTVQQRLGFANTGLRENIDLTSVHIQDSTHVVTGIDWGLQTVVEATHHLRDGVDRASIDDAFRRDLEALKDAMTSGGEDGTHSVAGMELEHELILYTDALQDEGLMIQGTAEVATFIQLLSDQLSQASGGKGTQVSYTLLPLSMLQHFFHSVGDIGATIIPINPESVSKFVHLFDDFAACDDKLKGYAASLESSKWHVAESHMDSVVSSISLLEQSMESVKDQLARILVGVRTGKMDHDWLGKLYDQANASPGDISAIAGQELAKLEFVGGAVALGANYIGHNGISLQAAIKPKSKTDQGCYVFLFSHTIMQNKTAWDENFALLVDLLGQPDRMIPVYIADCDAASVGMNLDAPRICQFKDGQEIVPDLVEQNKFLAGKCFARYHQGSIDTANHQKPVKRRFVKIPCPGSNCRQTRACEWTCPSCLVPIEWGFSDEFIYCDCGRTSYDAFEFKCNGENHGPDYQGYDTAKLHQRLNRLDQSDYLNILILGETGVGKSTFINAFVNYLSYSTLDEAKDAEELVWVIPCSFSLQVMDRENLDQEIQEKHIRIGSRDDEVDGAKGSSATQQTAVYPVTIGSVTYRLIDTPGIGDTRGVSFDQKNMRDILDTLGSYDTLHGIVILLKSNNARLNATFRFCIKELLAHLHRSAAQNMVFGFTNTRISNYTPGDTFGPLKALLKEHSEIGLTLSTHTTYCFDSESFRYLAAYKKGVQLPNEEDFRRSWEHSSKEAHRLLDHFKKMPPHSTTSTISLNGARQLIQELTAPMAEISQLIRNNIALMEDQVQELKDTRLTAESLRKKMHLEKIQFESSKLQKPRTVCKNSRCCDFKDSGKGDGEVVTIYKTHCHPVCYLREVKQDVVADPGLINCAAFTNNVCDLCGHRWQEHMHVLYELNEVQVQVKDTEIERQLRANANDVTLRTAGITKVTALIKEYTDEHKEIQEAAARFGLFLKKYAMSPINDATLAYVDMLIQNEEVKINAGQQQGISVKANLKRLQALKEDKRAHIELVRTLTRNMNAPRSSEDQVLDERGVEILVNKLYGLKHFGRNLESIKKTIASAHQATYRERPFRVPQRRFGSLRQPRVAVSYGSSSRGSRVSRHGGGGLKSGLNSLLSFVSK